MLVIDLSKEMKINDEPTCKGLVFRAHINSYISKRGSIEVKKSLKPLKKKSCKGCKRCDWIMDFIQGDIEGGGIEDYIGEIEDQKLYTVSTHWSPGPYEYPADGDMKLSFVKWKEEKEG